MTHQPRYRMVRWRLVTVTCRCGWISENHRTRGEAYRAWQAHQDLAGRRRVHAVFGINAHRKGDR